MGVSVLALRLVGLQGRRRAGACPVPRTHLSQAPVPG